MEKKNRLAAAHAAIARSGKHPREIGRENLKTLLVWIYNWGFVSPAIVLDLFGRTGGAYADKFVQKDLLVATATESGNPARYYTLTKLGLEEALRHAQGLWRYPELNRYRVNQDNLRHDLIAQKITLDALKYKKISAYATERMMDPKLAAAMAAAGAKKVDVIWSKEDAGRVGIEVELRGKFGHVLDQTILRYIRGLNVDDPDLRFLDAIRIVSDSIALLERYGEAIAPGAPLALWEQDKRGKWQEVGNMKVPDWLWTKVSFGLINSRGQIIPTLRSRNKIMRATIVKPG